MIRKIKSVLLVPERECGLIYFVLVIGVLICVWVFLVTQAIHVQREAATEFHSTETKTESPAERD